MICKFIIYNSNQFRTNIVGLLISLSNTFGLFLLTSLLGYGIASFPRFLWNLADYKRRLREYEFKAAHLFDSGFDSKNFLILSLVQEHTEKLIETLNKVKAIDKRVRFEDDLRKYVDQLIISVISIINSPFNKNSQRNIWNNIKFEKFLEIHFLRFLIKI